MKIEGKKTQKSGSLEKTSGKKGDSPPGIFETLLGSSESEEIKKVLIERVQKVNELGQVFVRFPTQENLDNYKEEVTRLLKEALPEILKLSEIRGGDPDGKQKIYFKIDRLKNSIQELTDSFINRDKEQFNLIQRMDEIRGLIVDLYK